MAAAVAARVAPCMASENPLPLRRLSSVAGGSTSAVGSDKESELSTAFREEPNGWSGS